MRAVLSRVLSASVEVEGKIVNSINVGYLILLGIRNTDTAAEAIKLAKTICNLRIFNDENGKMNLNINSANGEFLIVSQFTLFADCKSRRPSFSIAANSETAFPLYELFVDELKNSSGLSVKTGCFGEHMNINSVNNGPVTIIIDTNEI
jgi:D-tyrosyl-tRNA(Tyr) deacylase